MRSSAIIALGLLLAAQGLGKLANLSGYVAALGAFEALPGVLLWPVAVVWLVLEVGSGAALVQGRFARHGALGALAISVGYALLTVSASVRGLVVPNCTCFGVFLPQALGASVLVQDAIMVIWSGWAVKATAR